MKKEDINVNQCDLYNLTPLCLAARNGYSDIVAKLLEKGAISSVGAKTGNTPLHEAARNGHSDIVAKLLENRASANTVNRVGKTPMHLAVQEGHSDVVARLSKEGAIVDIMDCTGKTQLDLAQEKLAQNPRNDDLKGVVKVLNQQIQLLKQQNSSRESGSEISGSRSSSPTFQEGKQPTLNDVNIVDLGVSNDQNDCFKEKFTTANFREVEFVPTKTSTKQLLIESGDTKSCGSDNLDDVQKEQESSSGSPAHDPQSLDNSDKSYDSTSQQSSPDNSSSILGQENKDRIRIEYNSCKENSLINVQSSSEQQERFSRFSNTNESSIQEESSFKHGNTTGERANNNSHSLSNSDKNYSNISLQSNAQVDVIKQDVEGVEVESNVGSDKSYEQQAASWENNSIERSDPQNVSLQRDNIDDDNISESEQGSASNKSNVFELCISLISDVSASEDQLLEKVKHFVKIGGNVNLTSKDNKTLLHLACQNSKWEVAKYLIRDTEVRLDLADNDNKTPLHHTGYYIRSQSSHYLLEKEKVVELILKKINEDFNQDQQQKYNYINAKDKRNYTILHLAAKNGHSKVVKILLDEGANTGAKNIYDWTSLHLAARNGHSKVVKILLDKGADIGAKNMFICTPLHYAAEKGYVEVVKALLEAKDIDVNAKNKWNSTPLHYAAEKGYVEVVKALLNRGANIYATSERGQRPSNFAEEGSIKDILCNTEELFNCSTKEEVEDCIERGAIVHATDKRGCTPLHFAAEKGNEEVVKALLEAKDIDVNAKEKDGWIPLHVAAENGKEEVVKALLNKGADVKAKNIDGNTPLNLAREKLERDPENSNLIKIIDLLDQRVKSPSNVSQSEGQLPEKAGNEPQTYLNNPTVGNQSQKSL